VYASEPTHVNIFTLFGMNDKQITGNEFESVLDREKLDLLMKLPDFNKMSVKELYKLASKFSVDKNNMAKNLNSLEFLMQISR